MKKRILVTGAAGQLGMELQDIAKLSDNEFIFVTREKLTIEDSRSVDDIFSNNRFDFCINCAAYTAVDLAEQAAEQAFAINAEGVKNLAEACKKSDTVLIHISTDYVFDGNGSIPYAESDTTSPVNTYGASKLKGEQLAFEHHDKVIVIRTSWLYSYYGKNFVKTMVKSMYEKAQLNVVNDQFGSPTYARDLALFIYNIIQKPIVHPGIYHYCNNGIISWYDFAMAIKKMINSDCDVQPVDSSGFPTPAKRPKYSALDNSLATKAFNITIPEWYESLTHCLERMKG